MKFYNKGIAAHLITMLELLDDDHLIFSNVCGVGPIDVVTINIKTCKSVSMTQSQIVKADTKSDH